VGTRSIAGLALSIVVACAAASRQRESDADRGEPIERRHLVVTGEIGRDDQVSLDPFLVVPARGEPAAPPAGTEYAIELLDADGEALSSTVFGLSFQEEVFEEDGARVADIDVTPFAVTVDLPEGVATVRLRRGGLVLAERTRSPNPPVVAIVSARRFDGEIEVRWRARDADGDALSYILSYSADGAAYASVAIDLDVEELRFDPSPIEPIAGRDRVRVVASDGFNTGEASFPVE
jgi:hypothetical protein